MITNENLLTQKKPSGDKNVTPMTRKEAIMMSDKNVTPMTREEAILAKQEGLKVFTRDEYLRVNW